jgi:hypothetical protein
MTRAVEEPVPSTVNSAARAITTAAKPIAGAHLARLDVAIAVTRATVVVGVLVAAVVLRNARVSV